MKDIAIYTPPKYRSTEYQEVAPNIYQSGNHYVTSISFRQEPALREGCSAAEISQYPLEDLLDLFHVNVSDFYPALNTKQSTVCYLEFSARKIDCIKTLHTIVGKRVYNKAFYKDGEEYVDLIIE